MHGWKGRSFEEIFQAATGYPAPFPYQKALGTGDWPDLLHVPTGLGKTAAVGLSWIYKRLLGDPGTPRRLIYCLPMRVLVEQTVEEFRGWLSALEVLGEEPGPDRVSVRVLMGGEDDVRMATWARYPEANQVLVGTQDMLLSRALMRGYGMSRYQWPVHFSLLHNDALWALDEVQLMGAGLATSAQLEAFRRRMGTGLSSRSLWVSATLRPEWLETVDFRGELGKLDHLGISDADRARAGERLAAIKRIQRATTRLSKANVGSRAGKYLKELTAEVLDHHRDGEQTLVVMNRVDRAQGLLKRLLRDAPHVPSLLVHARFRARERAELNRRLKDEPGPKGRIIVATQAVEAGVDLSSRTLFTELAPWDSMIQRFGRCNRYGEVQEGADVLWVDIEDELDEAAPYDVPALAFSRSQVEQLESASPADLPEVGMDRERSTVLRQRDLVDLFDTDADLSGFDVDIAPYIRDPGSPQVQVFWREFDGRPGSLPPPHRPELCPISMGQLAAYRRKTVKKSKRPVWFWDPLDERWRSRREKDPVSPGSTLLLRAQSGGYNPDLGFVPEHSGQVTPLPPPEEGRSGDGYDGDLESTVGEFVTLSEHTRSVVAHVDGLLDALHPRSRADDSCELALRSAAEWHDVGKVHPAFQTALLDAATGRLSSEHGFRPDGGPWAKSAGRGRLHYRIEHEDEVELRPHFRHELASALAWLAHGDPGEHRDLVAYLVAAHHGRVRMGLRALPTEPVPDDDRLFARGVWEGDQLPAVHLTGISVPETTLQLDVMRLGLGVNGPSWTERARGLLSTHGPFRLAWLESLLRIADWRASAAEEAS